MQGMCGAVVAAADDWTRHAGKPRCNDVTSIAARDMHGLAVDDDDIIWCHVVDDYLPVWIKGFEFPQ